MSNSEEAKWRRFLFVAVFVACLAGHIVGAYHAHSWHAAHPKVLVYSADDMQDAGWYAGHDGVPLEEIFKEERWKHAPEHLRMIYLEHYGRGVLFKRRQEEK